MQTHSGLSIASFRLASSQRRYDRTRGVWVEAETNWYTVTAFRQLADHACASISKGDRVIVTGRLRVRAWENGERSGISVEVDAEALGPDLLWGTTVFAKAPAHAAEPGAHDPRSPTESEVSPLPAPAPDAGDRDPAGAPGEAPAAGQGGVQAAPFDASPRELVGASASTAAEWHPAREEPPF